MHPPGNRSRVPVTLNPRSLGKEERDEPPGKGDRHVHANRLSRIPKSQRRQRRSPPAGTRMNPLAFLGVSLSTLLASVGIFVTLVAAAILATTFFHGG